MPRYATTCAAISVITLLSACGGGGGAASNSISVESYAAQLAEFNNDPSLSSPTANATVDGLNCTATYNGVANIATTSAASATGSAAYFGALSVMVAFSDTRTDDPVSGEITNFVEYFSEIASPDTGQAVRGSVDLTGALTGDNT